MDNVIIAAAILALVYLFWGDKKKAKKAETVQELFNYKKIHSDGLIELPGHQFRKMIQVYPIDISTRSPKEQAAIWETYRDMVSSLTLPVTYIVQSTNVDVTDYINHVVANLAQFTNPLIQEMGNEYLNHIRDMAESRKVRARKYYIIVKIDLNTSEVMNSEEEGAISSAINSILRLLNKQKKLSDEEAEMLAKSELDNTISVLRSYLNQMDIRTEVLDKQGVVNMVYETFNRDLSTVIRTKEVNEMEAFSLFTNSATPGMWLASN